MTAPDLRAVLPPAALMLRAVLMACIAAAIAWLLDAPNLLEENHGFEAAQQLLLALAIIITIVAFRREVRPLVVLMVLATAFMAVALFIRETPNCRVVDSLWCVAEGPKIAATVVVGLVLIAAAWRHLPTLFAQLPAVLRSLVWWPFVVIAALALLSEVGERSGMVGIEEACELLACALLLAIAAHLARRALP